MVKVVYIDSLSQLPDAASRTGGVITPVPTATIQELLDELLADRVYLVHGEDQVRVTNDDHLRVIREDNDVRLIALARAGEDVLEYSATKLQGRHQYHQLLLR